MPVVDANVVTVPVVIVAVVASNVVTVPLVIVPSVAIKLVNVADPGVISPIVVTLKLFEINESVIILVDSISAIVAVDAINVATSTDVLVILSTDMLAAIRSPVAETLKLGLLNPLLDSKGT